MKKILLASLIAATAATTTFAADDTTAGTTAATTVAGGSVTINGEITAGACAISSDDSNKIVTLDTVPSSKFTAAGQAANTKKQFTITLVDCDTDSAKSVDLTFKGMQDADVASLLANTAGAGGAKNVGVQLYNQDGSVLPVNTGTASFPINTTVPMMFAADYVATAAAVTAGRVEAVANFELTYQ